MFFQGTLQEGIAAAVQDAKLVVCFVTDDGTESKLWEEEFLTDISVESLLRAEAVLLRLKAGSEEAKYLAAIFPIPKTPTLVLIRNGELKEYIAAGTVREEFLRRVRKSLGIMPPSDPAQPAPEQQLQQPPAGHRSAGVDVSARDFSSGTSSSALGTPVSSSRGEQVEEQQQPRSSRDKGKGRAEPEPSSDSAAPQAGKPHADVAKASDDYKRRKLEAQQARRRILEQIEHDKAARREREEQRKLARLAAAAGDDEGQNTTASSRPAETAQPSTGPISSASAAAASRQSKTCALQVRDFDGSTIRTRLASSGTLRKEVREWVDASRVAAGQTKDPYLFKVVLTPLPNRTIEETEEDQSLADLGLAPSSTLILAPVRRFATAYGGPGGPSGGLLASLWAMILGFLNPIFLLFRAVPARREQLQGGEEIEMARLNRPRHQQDQSSNPAGRQEQGSARVTGFRNPNDDRKDQQLYNGNSLNFEPRPDEE
ncbi:hypothetical protein MAPG_02320 [Magnaporthiopsis poae ATCC 64411]|uniref:UBX domain-containing protein 2 n=1 Tax=Magnaporthiopsis poae (strain ATCC 64411 / 73-15) TaxID=644358 RepID=A0A0C4DR20_MAGP6|nr:hypothetical protein MAPG_02320 [Magnaporthiopsis poae ATCC 64411]